jgi:hypothetical protein
MGKSLLILSSYGSDSEVFISCAKNWEAYANKFPKVKLLSVGESKEVEIDQICKLGQSLFYGIPSEESQLENSYNKSYKWSTEKTSQIYKKHRALYRYVIDKLPLFDFYYWCNITALVSLPFLTFLIDRLPYTNIYGGSPILFKNRSMIYFCGSNVLYSRDAFFKLIDRFISTDPVIGSPEHQAIDIWWTQLLPDVPKIILPMSNISFKDQRTASDTRLLRDKLDQRIEEGHFQFRFKNEISPDERLRLDPHLQFDAMSKTLFHNEQNFAKSLDLVNSYSKTWLSDGSLSVVSY